MATDEPLELLPCAICGRTFKPQSLEKHAKICEHTAAKKRKPFDSSKQRIQGTELAEFLPKETIKRRPTYQPEERVTSDKSTWKQTHDEFLRAIRAARGENVETGRQKSLASPGNVTLGVPTRPNEKGMCPTCNRQFSIKSYERHVAWCKERATRVPANAATNIAKERLEARMKYRAPALKNRRPTNREKYSPTSALNLSSVGRNNANPNASNNNRAKETVSSPNCNDINSKIPSESVTGNHQKSTINARRSGQNREGISSGPMKSRLSDRSNRPPTCEIVPGRCSDNSSPRDNYCRISSKRIQKLPIAREIGKLKNRSVNEKSTNRDEIVEDVEKTENLKLKVFTDGTAKNRPYRSFNIVHARSHGNPRINDIAINDGVTGMSVQAVCLRKKILGDEHEFITWKKIGESRKTDFLKFHSIEASRDSILDPPISLRAYGGNANEAKIGTEKSVELGNISWASGIEKLDRTYSIRESFDTDLADLFTDAIRRPVVESPRNSDEERSKCKNSCSFIENLDEPKCSAGSNRSINKIDGNKSKENSPLWKTRELEPLDLTDVGIEEDSQTSGTRGSEKTTSRAISHRKSARNRQSAPSEKNQGRSFSDETLSDIQREKNLRCSVISKSSIDREPATDRDKMAKKSALLEKRSSTMLPHLAARDSKTGDTTTKEIDEVQEANCDYLVSKKMAEMRAKIVDLNFGCCKNNVEPKKIQSDSFIGDSIAQMENNILVSISQASEARDGENEKHHDIETDCQLTDRVEKSAEEMENTEKIEKSNETENSSRQSNPEGKMIYQRCGTYVIDKKVNSTIAGTRDDLSDDPPLQKRKKMNDPETDPKESLALDNTSRKKCIPDDKAESEDDRIACEELAIECKNLKNPRIANCRKIESSDTREVCEKFVNAKFDYESDEAPVNENCLRCLESESSPGINTQLLSEPIFTDFLEKSFSDSCVRGEKFENKSLKFANKSQIQKISETTEKSGEEKMSTKYPMKPEASNFSRSAQKSLHENSLEWIFSKRQRKDRLQGAEEFKEKNCPLPDLPSKPEVQNSLEMRRKLRKKMKLLRGSTNDLITSVETLDDSTNNRGSSTRVSSVETRSIGEIEEETIRVIDFGKLRKIASASKTNFGFLPEIPIDRINAKNEIARNVKKLAARGDRASFSPWQKSARTSNHRLINLHPPRIYRDTKIPASKVSNVGKLPLIRNGCEKRSGGATADYDPFLIAERQMNDLLLSDTSSERSLTDSSSKHHPNNHHYHHDNYRRRGSSLSPSLPNYPLSHSSAFVKYVDDKIGTSDGTEKKSEKLLNNVDKRASVIAPPMEFEDFSSDSTETNSIACEIAKSPIDDATSRRFTRDTDSRANDNEARKNNSTRPGVLGRRVIIDKSKALGKPETRDNIEKNSMRLFLENTSPINSGKVRQFFEKRIPKVTRSNSLRTKSLPRQKNEGTKTCQVSSAGSDSTATTSERINGIRNIRNKNCPSLSGSNVSLCSIVSSDIDASNKTSNSNALDELVTSCDEDPSSPVYPSLRYLLKNDSLSVTSPVRTYDDTPSPNGLRNSDEEFSSPESYKRHAEHGKVSADSAYSSLNRKYSNHGRNNANDLAGVRQQDDDSPQHHHHQQQHHRREIETVSSLAARSKMSKFCHECGSKFPETAKFCCECGVRRLAL